MGLTLVTDRGGGNDQDGLLAWLRFKNQTENVSNSNMFCM